MHVNLEVQGIWDVIEHGDDIEKLKDRMTFAVIYQVVLEDIFHMLAEKNSAKVAWETLQTMHVSVEWVKEAKCRLWRMSSDERERCGCFFFFRYEGTWQPQQGK